MMKLLLVLIIVNMLVFEPQNPQRRSLVAGSSDKSDSLEKIQGDNVTTNGIKKTINISGGGRGSSSGGGRGSSRGGGRGSTTGGRSPRTSGGGGAAVIPVYTAGSAGKHNTGVHHSGTGHGHRSSGRVGILITAILISFCLLN